MPKQDHLIESPGTTPPPRVGLRGLRAPKHIQNNGLLAACLQEHVQVKQKPESYGNNTDMLVGNC